MEQLRITAIIDDLIGMSNDEKARWKEAVVNMSDAESKAFLRVLETKKCKVSASSKDLFRKFSKDDPNVSFELQRMIGKSETDLLCRMAWKKFSNFKREKLRVFENNYDGALKEYY